MFEIIDQAPQDGAIIKVIGVGGCGGNAVEHMIAKGLSGVDFICANTDAQALKRSTARVQLQLGVRDNAVWVPEQAIVPRGQDAFVFRVVADKVELVQVRTGVRKVGEVEILTGLEGGDLVVTEGTQRIGPGSPVSVLPQKPAAALPDKKG